jgi:hypothetical protein
MGERQAPPLNPTAFDIIIKRGTVYDGNGGKPKPADVLQPNQREKHLKAFTRIELR